MANNYGVGAYKKTSVHTASKEQVLLMLYQAAIRNCKKAIDAINNKQIAQKGEHLAKFQDIVVELNNSLDFKVGGEIARDLSALYDYLLFSSTQANIKMDATQLEGCLKVLNILYDGWNEAIKSLRVTNPGQSASQAIGKEA